MKTYPTIILIAISVSLIPAGASALSYGAGDSMFSWPTIPKDMKFKKQKDKKARDKQGLKLVVPVTRQEKQK